MALRSFGVLAFAAALGACESRGALELVVTPPPGVTKVRLYFGIGDPMTGPIAPEGYTTPITPNTFWRLDEPYASADLRDTGDGADVVFQLQRGDHADEATLALAIVVGFGGDPAQPGPVAVARLGQLDIPGNSVERRRVELLPLDNTRSVWTWPTDTDRCVSLHTTEHGQEMIVGADDIDCDGDKDCVPNRYMSRLTSPLDLVDCLADEPVVKSGSIVDACVLGGPACIDGMGMVNSCERTPYCVPKTACTRCRIGQDLMCLRDTLGHFNGDFNSLATYVGCTAGIDPMTGTICTLPMPVDLGLPLKNGASCSNQILIAGGTGSFGATATLGGLGPTVDLAVSDVKPNCDFTLTVTSQTQIATTRAFGGIVAGMLDTQPDKPTRGFAIPLVLNIETGRLCSEGSCTVKGVTDADLVDECLNTPVMPVMMP